MISVRNLNFSYADDQMILQDINLEIEDGQYVAVIGANGSGKTTLIRHFNALLRPASGDVLVNGLSTRYVKSHPEIRRMIGMIFQNPDNQMVGMTVEEDVAFGPGNLGLSSAEIRKRVDEALEKVGLSEYKTRPPIHFPAARSSFWLLRVYWQWIQDLLCLMNLLHHWILKAGLSYWNN